MGYYTQYDLSVSQPEVLSPTEIIEQLRQKNLSAQLSIDASGGAIQPVKWYEHEADLKQFSTFHPDRLFALHCKGEDGAEWIVYVKNGKSYRSEQERVFPPFDKDKLK